MYVKIHVSVTDTDVTDMPSPSIGSTCLIVLIFG